MTGLRQWFGGVAVMLVVVSVAPAQFMDDFDDIMPPGGGRGRGMPRGARRGGKIIGGSVLDMAQELRLSRAVIKKVEELLKEKDEKEEQRQERLEIQRERIQDSMSRARSPRTKERLQQRLRKLQDRQRMGKEAEREEKACAEKIMVLLTERQRKLWNTRNLTQMVLAKLRSVRLDREQQEKAEAICKEAVGKIKKQTDLRFTPSAVNAPVKQIVAKLLTPKQQRQYRRLERQEREKERKAREARKKSSRSLRGGSRGSRRKKRRRNRR